MKRVYLFACAMCLSVTLSADYLYGGSKEDLVKHRQETNAHVVRVEEHWKVRVAYPDPKNRLPELLMVATPTTDFDGPHMVFSLNHISEPSFQRGGVQLLAYHGQQLLVCAENLHSQQLNNIGEDIEIRFAVEVQDNLLHYKVFELKSKSWGDHKGEDWMHIAAPTTLTSLDNYNADLTHRFTGAANGVHTLAKIEVTKV